MDSRMRGNDRKVVRASCDGLPLRRPHLRQYFRRRIVATEVTDPKLELTPKEAGPQYEPGDYFDEEVTPKDFGRIAAQTAKQVMIQRIREHREAAQSLCI